MKDLYWQAQWVISALEDTHRSPNEEQSLDLLLQIEAA